MGKTTTAINLATALAACGKRLLLVDIDPQGNATTGLGVARDSIVHNSYDVLVDGVPMGDAILPTQVPQLWVVPGGEDLAGAELELAGATNREFRLRDQLASVAGRFDFVLIDINHGLHYSASYRKLKDRLAASDNHLQLSYEVHFCLRGKYHL